MVLVACCLAESRSRDAPAAAGSRLGCLQTAKEQAVEECGIIRVVVANIGGLSNLGLAVRDGPDVALL